MIDRMVAKETDGAGVVCNRLARLTGTAVFDAGFSLSSPEDNSFSIHNTWLCLPVLHSTAALVGSKMGKRDPVESPTGKSFNCKELKHLQASPCNPMFPPFPYDAALRLKALQAVANRQT